MGQYIIELTKAELEIAKLVGKLRSEISKKNNLIPGAEYKGNREYIDIIGAAGEMAVAKLLGVYWTAGINTFHGSDLGINIQVRTARKKGYSLIVRDSDNDQHAYILVISQPPRYHIIGWLWGYECKQSEYWRAPNNRPGAWFVPQDKLKNITTLEIVKQWIDN